MSMFPDDDYLREYAELITPNREELALLRKAIPKESIKITKEELETDPTTGEPYQYLINGTNYTLKELEDEIKWANKAYDCLQTIGVDSPLELTLEQAQAIYSKFGTQISDLLTSMGHPDPYRERNYN